MSLLAQSSACTSQMYALSFSQSCTNYLLTYAFKELRKSVIRLIMPACPPACLPVCLSVCPHGTTRLPLGRFSWDLIFEYFSKICRENSSSIKTWLTRVTVRHTKTSVYIQSYLVVFFVKWEMFHTEVVQKKNIFYVQLIFFPRKSCHSWDNVEKYGRAKAKVGNIVRRRKDAICMPNTYGKDTDTHTHTHTHS